ncbi:hypothetical protein HNQ96_006217 [Aminobacter lissarensis]|uniref:Uncharacterized protein n=1 Tax=Aminobacter carboxidus TaxID=376165 RepID=A0A8E2BGZ4_9HYPH|nr:hypothetical protein [Aminobacter lissarensis]MBB6470320.1 hypothetical protein [Aminobacter lissarensis]
MTTHDAIVNGEMVVQAENRPLQLHEARECHTLGKAPAWCSTPSICLLWTAATCATSAAKIDGCGCMSFAEIRAPPARCNSARRSKALAPSSSQRRKGWTLKASCPSAKPSIYRSGDSKDWLKTKAYITGEFVVIGYERKRGAPPSLLLAEENEASLRYVGRAIPAVPGAQCEELWQALEFLQPSHFATPSAPATRPPCQSIRC